MKQITVAIVGCGARGMETYAKCLEKLGDQVKMIAAADINAETLHRMQEKYALPVQMCFSSAEEILRQPRLADAMLICTPDRLHYEQALRALRLDYHLLLEKPISSSARECQELARVAIERKRHVIVCHVLRYTVFYQKVKEIIDSGVLGDVVSIQAIEQVGYWHQAHSFVRGNWRDAARSTPMILQKCCHDMDIFLWLTGKHGKRVSSFGSLRHFKAENAPDGAPMRCADGCPVKDTCPYNAERFYLQRLKEAEFDWPVNVVISEPSEALLLKALREGPYGCCVYHCDNDVVDHQVVNVEFEDGLTLNFTMCAFTAHGGRTLRVMGTHGELTGDMKKNIINVMPFVGEETEIDVTMLTDDFSGHSGGDMQMINEFVQLLAGQGSPSQTLSSIDHSVESHLIALAAEQSRRGNGCVIEIER